MADCSGRNFEGAAVAHAEYLRRNLRHAGSVGAVAAARVALERLNLMKRPPVWIVSAFESIESRVEQLPHELAQWRDAAPDSPKKR